MGLPILGMLAETELIPFLSEKERNMTDLDSLDGKPGTFTYLYFLRNF